MESVIFLRVASMCLHGPSRYLKAGHPHWVVVVKYGLPLSKEATQVTVMVVILIPSLHSSRVVSELGGGRATRKLGGGSALGSGVTVAPVIMLRIASMCLHGPPLYLNEGHRHWVVVVE
jgi:hypothetical protein